LTQHDIDTLTPFDIYKLGEKPRVIDNGDEWLGGELVWQIPANFDKEAYDKIAVSDVEVPVSDREFAVWFDTYNVAPCLRKMAADPHLNYEERFQFVVCLKTIGFSEEEVDIILQKTLDYVYYEHAVHGDEEIIHRCFHKGKQQNAWAQGCTFMKKWGYCCGNCDRKHPVYK
jgi:hypothetical protein